MEDVTLEGYSGILIIPLAVEAFKRMGMPERFAPWLALGLSYLWVAGATYLAGDYTPPVIVAAVIAGFLLFLAVTGAYHITHNVAENTIGKDRNLPGPGR